MADVRVTDKGVVTTLDGTEYAGVFIAAGDKRITYDNQKNIEHKIARPWATGVST